MNEAVRFVDIDWAGRSVRFEHQWIGCTRMDAPLIVFLHEGLGSVSMWNAFPTQLCEAAACRGLVYSRPGYGGSTQRSTEEKWGIDFMHRQAYEVLPALLKSLQIDCTKQKTWLFGHSDGGSIALLYAARFTDQVAGAIVLSPHILVEQKSIDSIEKARSLYLETDKRQRLAKHHRNPDSAFWGWNDIWLHPHFRDWSIEVEVESIRCPILAVQGLNDEYGTLEQIQGIARRVPQTELLELSDCGHSPHRDQAERLIASACAFIQKQTGDIP